MKKNKKTILTISALILIAAMFLTVLSGCTNLNLLNQNKDSEENQTLAFAAASTFSILQQNVASDDLSLNNKSSLTLTEPSTITDSSLPDDTVLPETDDNQSTTTGNETENNDTEPDFSFTPITDAIDSINNYILIFEGYVGNVNPVENKIEKSDREGYEYKMTITLSTTQTDTEEFVLYYKEELIKNDDDDFDEEEYRLSGIIIYNGYECLMEGKRSVEKDENELEFVAKLDENTKVVFEQELENGEQEFEYSVYVNGKLINAFSVELETKDNKTELEITTTVGNHEFTLKLTKRTVDGNEYYCAEYKDGNIELEFKFFVTYEDGKMKVKYESEGGFVTERIRNRIQEHKSANAL